MVLIEYRTYIPRGYGLIGFIIISFLYKELAARARENYATTEYLQARYSTAGVYSRYTPLSVDTSQANSSRHSHHRSYMMQT